MIIQQIDHDVVPLRMYLGSCIDDSSFVILITCYINFALNKKFHSSKSEKKSKIKGLIKFLYESIRKMKNENRIIQISKCLLKTFFWLVNSLIIFIKLLWAKFPMLTITCPNYSFSPEILYQIFVNSLLQFLK